MPIANTRRAMTGGNFGSPKLDLGGCVFHAPLWRPDMVARGGSIVSGTGTMAVTPLTLAVGANTVTALTAGTFIITLPQAGTCASGDATITGSPVTIPAGVATTVTTGVTTGTFTVTTSNIIRSKDSIGHLCTVTDATWNYQGRTFDGTNDYIVIPDNVAFDWTSLTLMAWINCTNTGTQQQIMCKDGVVRGDFYWCKTNSDYLRLALKADSGWHDAIDDTTNVGNTGCRLVASTYQGVADGTSIITHYIDGVQGVQVTNAKYPITLTNQSIYVGVYSDLSEDFAGIIPEVWICVRALSASEMMRIYQAIKRGYRL